MYRFADYPILNAVTFEWILLARLKDKRNLYMILVGNPEGKRSLERTRFRLGKILSTGSWFRHFKVLIMLLVGRDRVKS
jgi:hypothetical protein